MKTTKFRFIKGRIIAIYNILKGAYVEFTRCKDCGSLRLETQMKTTENIHYRKYTCLNCLRVFYTKEIYNYKRKPRWARK